MEGSSSRSRNNDRCYGAVLDFIASRGYPASEGIQHASTFALRYPRLRWWRAALSAQHLLSAMPTHAEVIAQNPLEAPADFWTNVINGLAAFFAVCLFMGSFVWCCLLCINRAEKWEERSRASSCSKSD
ncbi:unnamed protein product [Effrenium voratum]|nr:unnamed protein product [Effrenium voratum]